MWPSFDELRKSEQSKAEPNNLKKRKSIDNTEKLAFKRRRRSLFNTNCKSQHRDVGPSFRARPLNEHKIGDFSSDEEEHLCRQKKSRSSLEKSKRSHKLEKFSEASSKSKNVGRNNKQQNSLNSSILNVGLEENFIKWSDSDNENDSSAIQKGAPRDSKAEQVEIEVFDSPVKSKGVRDTSAGSQTVSSQASIDDCTSSTQLTGQQLPLPEYDLVDGAFPKPFDSSKKRRCKDIKGGLVEQLRKVISRERSDVAFWKHSLDEESNELTDDNPGEDWPSLVLKVVQVHNDVSLSVLTCSTLGKTSKAVSVVLPHGTMAGHAIENGDILQVHSPFRKFNVKGLEAPVILCAYFVRVITRFFKGNADVCHDLDSFQNVIQTAGSQPISSDRSDTTSVHSAKQADKATTHMATEFCKLCDSSQPVSFSARVIKSSLSTRKCPTDLRIEGGGSIIESFVKNCKETEKQERLCLSLILEDVHGQIAVLTSPLVDGEISELCNNNELEGKSMIFRQAIFKGVKSISFNPIISTCLQRLPLKAKDDVFLGDFYYVFSDCQGTCISLESMQISLACEESEMHPVPNNRFQRFSFYAQCGCVLPGIHHEDPSSEGSFSICFIKCKDNAGEQLNSTDGSILTCVEKLPTCYIPECVTSSFLEKRNVFFLQDLLQNVETKQYLLDELSKVTLIQSRPRTEIDKACNMQSYGVKMVEEGIMATLVVDRPLLLLKRLSLDCVTNSLALVEGEISGIIEESAMFWTACNSCGQEAANPVIQQKFFCTSCRKVADSKFCVQLEIVLCCENIPGVEVTVKLLEKRVLDYLPMEITEGFSGYDVECIIGRKFGQKLCYVTSLKKKIDANDGTVSVASISTKEVIVAEWLNEFMKQ